MHTKEFGSKKENKANHVAPEEYVSINGKKVFKNFIFDDEMDQVEIIYYSTNDKNKFLVELKCQGLYFVVIDFVSQFSLWIIK